MSWEILVPPDVHVMTTALNHTISFNDTASQLWKKSKLPSEGAWETDTVTVLFRTSYSLTTVTEAIKEQGTELF